MICSKCGVDKPDTEFRRRAGRQCRICVRAWHATHYQKPDVKARHREQGRRWRAENRQAQQEMDLRHRLSRTYGITIEAYNAMLAAQNNACAICKSSEPKRRGALRLFVDHDHSTGAVRGLLCHPCNLLIGLAEENLARLREAVEYLKTRKLRQSP